MDNVSAQTANALRRAVLAHIPVVAMRGFPDAESTIYITENTGPFNNEILKQRMQCIPVHLTDRSVDLDKYTIRIDVEATEGVRNVTTEDIKITWGADNTAVPAKTVREIFPPDPISGDYIIITRLNPAIPGVAPAEKLSLTAKLYWTDGSVEGTASAASTCSYAATPDLEKQAAAWSTISQTTSESTREHTDFLLGPGARMVIPNSYDWVIESIGVHEPMHLLGIACDVVLADVAANVAALGDPERIRATSNGAANAHDVRITGDEYAVGYLLQSEMYNKHCTKSSTNYVGFRKDHPHDSHATLRVALDTATTSEAVAAAVADAADAITGTITAIKASILESPKV